jgi:hypothetical protein
MQLHYVQLLTAFDKQSSLSTIVGDRDWQFNTETGILSFGDRYHWQAQLLGTKSDESQTWLWAWANISRSIPACLLVSSLALKAYGEQYAISELTMPQIPLHQIDEHTLVLLASVICDANAYYRCPYEGGALFLLIMDENFPKCTDPPLQRIATVFPQAIASLDIPDHRLALIGYLAHYGLSYEQEGEKIVVKEEGEVELEAIFDEHNRLTNLEVTLIDV